MPRKEVDNCSEAEVRQRFEAALSAALFAQPTKPAPQPARPHSEPAHGSTIQPFEPHAFPRQLEGPQAVTRPPVAPEPSSQETPQARIKVRRLRKGESRVRTNGSRPKRRKPHRTSDSFSS